MNRIFWIAWREFLATVSTKGFIIGILATPALIGIMIVATYVHVVVDDPSLFPLQPSEPIIPALVMLGSAFVLWRGGGSWSKDLKSTT